MRSYIALIFLLIGGTCSNAQELQLPTNTPASVEQGLAHDISSMNIHDPAILADKNSKLYYVYGNYSPKREDVLKSPNNRAGVKAFWSHDLKTWYGPKLVYEVEENSWADKQDAPWAPEVNYFNGKYYLFVTFNDWATEIEKREGRPKINKRAVQILVGDSPLGPFKATSNKPITPEGEMTLDGTLWVEDGKPWLIYAHEWVQVGDGLIKAIQLSQDLTKTIGQPLTLINAGDANWVKRNVNYRGVPTKGVVTDGPSLYKSSTGKLMLMWSSWSEKNAYTTALAYSDNGKLNGHWTHREKPLIWDDRGHGTIFKTFDSSLRVVLHRYFHQPATRMQIFSMIDKGDDLEISDQLFGYP